MTTVPVHVVSFHSIGRLTVFRPILHTIVVAVARAVAESEIVAKLVSNGT